mgnify:CR=1 FL=1
MGVVFIVARAGRIYGVFDNPESANNYAKQLSDIPGLKPKVYNFSLNQQVEATKI